MNASSPPVGPATPSADVNASSPPVGPVTPSADVNVSSPPVGPATSSADVNASSPTVGTALGSHSAAGSAAGEFSMYTCIIMVRGDVFIHAFKYKVCTIIMINVLEVIL